MTAESAPPPDVNERTRAQARAVLAASVSAHVDDFAEIIGGFFVAAGVEPSVGAAALERAAERVRAGQASLQVSEKEPWLALSDAIALWWRDPEYVDDAGRPRAVPDRGAAPSLEALFERTVAPSQRARARELLRQRVAVERDGRWHFVEDEAILRLGAREGVHRLLRGICGWFRTYLHNQTLVDEPVKLRHFDAAAHVANFPRAALPELCARVYKQLRIALEEFDGYMGAVAARGNPGPVTTVSITAFLHTAEPIADGASGAQPRAGTEHDDAVIPVTGAGTSGEESTRG
jgi:hypothetical protein